MSSFFLAQFDRLGEKKEHMYRIVGSNPNSFVNVSWTARGSGELPYVCSRTEALDMRDYRRANDE